MDLGIKGKVVIVTGAGRGIGRKIASTFGEEGCNVVVAEIDKATAQEAADEITALGVKAVPAVNDITDLDSVQKMVKETIDNLGKVDIIVHNAVALAPSTKDGKSFVEHKPEEWDIEIKSCYYGWLNLCYSVLPHMIERKSGVLLGMLSDGARVGERTEGVYDGAKAAMGGLARSLVKEVSRYGIRVNCVAPSWTDTELTLSMLDEFKAKMGDEKFAKFQKKALSVYPLAAFRGSRGKPADLANAVVFLCSEKASWITGQTLSVNGGYAIGPW